MGDTRHLAIGEWGEACAARYLKRIRYRILGQRVRFGPREEIDLVARDGDILVFIEVKTRKAEVYGRPADSVDRDKRSALSRAIVHYLGRRKYPNLHFRIDVIEVIGTPGDDPPTLRHIENAFTLDRRYRLPI